MSAKASTSGGRSENLKKKTLPVATVALLTRKTTNFYNCLLNCWSNDRFGVVNLPPVLLFIHVRCLLVVD